MLFEEHSSFLFRIFLDKKILPSWTDAYYEFLISQFCKFPFYTNTGKTNPEAPFSEQNNVNYTSGPKKDPKISDCQLSDATTTFIFGSVSKCILMFCECHSIHCNNYRFC